MSGAFDDLVPGGKSGGAFDDLVPTEQPRGALAEVGTAAVRGLYSGARGVGAIMQTPAERGQMEPGIVSRAGQALEEFGKAGEERNKAQPESHGPVTNFASQAAESIGGSAPVLAGAMAGGAAGSVLPGPGNIIGAAAGGAGAAALQTWHEKYQEGAQKGLNDDEARNYADKSAALSGAAMGALSAIPGGGAAARAALGAGKKSALEAGADVVGKEFLPEMGKQAASIVGGNTALGIGQAAAQAGIDNQNEKTAGLSPWEAAKAAAMPSLAGSVGFLPLGALHAKHEAAQAGKFKEALENPDAHPMARARAVNAVFEAMKGADETDAATWRVNAMQALKRKLPIGLDDSWVKGPHPDVFSKLLEAPKPIVAGAPQEEQAGGPSQAELDNDQRWKDREDAEAARQHGMAEPQIAGLLSAPEPSSDRPGAPPAAVEGQAPTLEPQPGPFPLSKDLNTDRLVNENDQRWAERDKVQAQREAQAQQIEQAGEGGTLSGAAAQAIRSGESDEAMGRRASAGEEEAAGAKQAPDEEVDENLSVFARGEEGKPLADAQQEAELREAQGDDYTVVRHPDGGFMTMPTDHVSPELAKQSEGLQTPGKLTQQERQMPLERAAAEKRAEDMTNQYGVEHDVVPHPMARDKFAVQAKEAFTGHEQPQEMNAGEEAPPAEATVRLRKGAGAELQQGPVDQNIERLFAEPSMTAKDRTGARAPTPDEAMQIHGALKHLEANGADMSRLGSLSGIHVSDTLTDTWGGDGGYYPETKGVVISPQFLARMREHPPAEAAHQLSMVIDHENWHHADHTERGRATGSDEFHSSTDPRFQIGPMGKDGREALGAIATEAVNAHESGSNPFRAILSYPLESLHDDAELHKVSDREYRNIMQNELFAQLGMIYNAYPEAMQKHLPQAYRLFREIHDAQRQDASTIGEAYARSIDRHIGAGGEGSVRADRGRSQEGTARDAVLQYEAGRSAGPRLKGRGKADGEVKSEELRGDGRGFTKFFEGATRGERKPNTGKKYEPVLNVSDIKAFSKEYAKHRGNFDDHIATSIPGFREVQQRVGNAIVKALPEGGRVLDIGASEGSLIKAISAQSEGRIQTVGLDPNQAMAEHFKKSSKVKGSEYAMAAFGSRADEGKLAWTEDNGKPIHFYRPEGKFDVVHEAMTFQFISDARDAQVARIKEMMAPGGVAMFEEKFIPEDKKVFSANEAQKDAYKSQYYSAAELERKKQDVLERGAEAHAADEKAKEEKVVGMHNLMVSPEAFEAVLKQHFEHVAQYWDSGNFKGYVASDSPEKLHAILQHTGDVNSEFATTQTPRQVQGHALAPGEHTVNIGLATNDGIGITREDAEKALNDVGVQIVKSAVHESDSEPTLAAKLSRPLTPEEAHKVSETLRQEAIAQVSDGKGELYGPAADKWGPFSSDHYLTPEGKRMSEVGPSGDETVSTRNPTAKGREENPLVQRADVGYEAMQREPALLKHNVELMHEYPNFARKTALKGTPQLAERMMKQIVENLLWLHDQVPKAIRERSKLWYDGAHRIANDWAAEYGVPRRAASGILAVLSPQKDWFMNVSLARRVLDTVTKQKDTAWSREMTHTAERILDLEKESMRDLFAAIHGKKLSDLTDAREKAVWVRLYDEAHNDRSYPIIHPEGDAGDFARNDNGQHSKVAWGDFGSIAKAISIFDNPSVQNIHDNLGVEHKVRNFYNNIVDPKSAGGHVTIDTHAVAAALLRPLAGGSTEVLHNFGSTVPAERKIGNTKNSSVLGSSGTYGIYADAYRVAAEARGLLPREMQSITWEAVRGLFEPKFKANKRNVANIERIWQDYAKGRNDLDETRERIKKAAGGITPPEWVSDAGLDAGARRRPDQSELFGSGVREGGAAGDGAGAAPAVPQGRPLARFSKGDRTLRPDELAPKATTGKAAEAEQQFTKRGEPVNPVERVVKPIGNEKDMPEWVRALPPEGREALRKAGVWVQTKTIRERWNEYKRDATLKLLQGTVDQFRPVLEKIGEYPYKLLRMASSSSGALDQSLRSGHIELNDWGALQIKKDTKGLLDILKPLGAETDRFLAWVAGNRAARLMEEDREHNFSKEQVAYLKQLNGKLHDADAWQGEGSRTMAYASALKEWNAYSKSIMDIAEKSGLIDGDARKQWENEFYVPFYRQADNTGPEHGNISGMVNKQAFKKLKGGQEELKDLLANSLGNWAHLLDASLRNNAAWQTLEHAEEKGIAQRIKEHEAANGDVFVMQNGKKRYYRVNDQLVLDAISSLSATPFKGPVMKAMTTFKNVLTHGVTMAPTFRIRNVIRDQISALAVNDVSYNFVGNIIDGFKYSSKDNPAYANMNAGGALMHMAHNAEGGYAEHVKRLISEGVDKATILDSPNKVSAMFKHAYEWWEGTGERSESLTRATLYRQAYAKAIEKGMPPERAHFEASYAARDSMDFGLRGTWPAVRMLTQVVPFMNARLQGLYKLGRGGNEMPARFAAVIGGVTLSTIALSLMNYGDKEIENLPDSDHDNNWIFRVGNTVYRIPKPFEVGALATVIDRGLRVALDGFQPSERELFMSRLWNVTASQLNMNPIPQAVWPAIQLWANYDQFRGAAIETGRDQNLTTSQRIGPNTSATAQLLGKAGVVSPEQIDFLVNAYMGWVGAHAVATADLALRPMMGMPEKPARRVDDYFMVGDFVHQLPSNQSRFVEKFYQHLSDVQQAMGDLRQLQQTGQTQAAAEYARTNKNTLMLAKFYSQTQREIGKLNQRSRYVQMRTEASMSPDEKRRELDRISQLKLRLSESAESYRARTIDRPQ